MYILSVFEVHECLKEALFALQAIGKDGAVVQALRARRQVILDNIRDNDELGVQYQTVMQLLFVFIDFFSCICGFTDFMSCRK